MTLSRQSQALANTLQRIDQQLETLSSLGQDGEILALRASRVSGWSIGEQIEHLRRAGRTIIDAVASLPEDAPRQGSPTLAGRLVLLLGWIPRGKGKAPSATQPLDFTSEGLADGIEAVRRGFADLGPELDRIAGSSGTIRHPALGYFSPSQMLEFAAIHHHHHMKIIDEIRRAERAGQP